MTDAPTAEEVPQAAGAAPAEEEAPPAVEAAAAAETGVAEPAVELVAAPAEGEAAVVASAAAAEHAGSKRPYEDDGEDAGAAAKRHEPAPVPPPAVPRAGPPRDTIFRLVVNVVDTALIIGKGGATVRQIESETGARVKRLQEPPGAREQVVIAWSGARDAAPPGTLNGAQSALVDCVRRIVMQDSIAHGNVKVQLLISRTQEAGVVGAGGSKLAGIAGEAGVSAAVKRGEELPACALDLDLMLELSGDRFMVIQAVEALSHEIRANPPMERPDKGGAPPALISLLGAGGGGGGYGGGGGGYQRGGYGGGGGYQRY